jgi:hypothetical protein
METEVQIDITENFVGQMFLVDPCGMDYDLTAYNVATSIRYKLLSLLKSAKLLSDISMIRLSILFLLF